MREGPDFKVGDRVRLSELGRSKSRNGDRKGVVVGLSKSGTQYRVQWDGLKERGLIHVSFLEHDEGVPLAGGPGLGQVRASE